MLMMKYNKKYKNHKIIKIQQYNKIIFMMIKLMYQMKHFKQLMMNNNNN